MKRVAALLLLFCLPALAAPPAPNPASSPVTLHVIGFDMSSETGYKAVATLNGQAMLFWVRDAYTLLPGDYTATLSQTQKHGDVVQDIYVVQVSNNKTIRLYTIGYCAKAATTCFGFSVTP